MEIKIDTTGIKDIERDGGLTLEEMAYQGSQECVVNSIGMEKENCRNGRE